MNSTAAADADRLRASGPDLPALTVLSPEQVLADPAIACIEPAEVWSRPAAEMVVDLSGAALVHSLLRPQRHERHATYQRRLTRACVFGHHHLHGFITDGVRFDCQDIKGTRRRLDYHVANHPGRHLPMPQIVKDGDVYRVDLSRLAEKDIEHIPATVCFGTPTEPINWGMWLLQGLPTAHDFARARPAEKYFCYMRRDWQKALLAAVGVPQDALLHHELGRTYQCDSVVLRQYSGVDLAPSPAERDIFERIVRKAVGADDGKAGRKLFIARLAVSIRNGGRRGLRNEPELVAAMAARGFEIMEPEQLAFADQVRLFREAEVVVGLGGAGLFNAVFCRPGARVLSLESSTAFVHDHALLFGSLGLRYGIIFGKQDPDDEAPIHKRWTIDVPAALAAIAAF